MSKLSPIQKQLLELYKSFKHFCDEHHLRYYAVAGTAIGAIRHHGFIPWDDDIDLGMPIEDFDKLKKLATKSLPKHLAFKESYWMGGKIHDTRTTVIDVRFLNTPQNYHGIYIDIFPLIGLPNNKSTQEKFITDIKLFQVNAELLEFFPEVSSFSVQEINKWKKHLLYANNFNTSKKLAAFCYFTCNGNGIRNPITIPFEDTEIPISSQYDSDLKEHFGDYMTLPPKAKRKTHDKYHIIDLEHPYSEYAKEYQKNPQWLSNILNQNHLIEGELTQLSNSLQYILGNKELEIKNLQSQLDATSQELSLLRNSKAYRIGSNLLKPVKKIKKGFKHEK